MSLENVVGLVAAILLVGYLVYALVAPERLG
ncbi:MAG: potassium-transporting ATPase subunit F [Gaiella sp.]